MKIVEFRINNISLNQAIRYFKKDEWSDDCKKWVVYDYYIDRTNRIRKQICDGGEEVFTEIKGNVGYKVKIPISKDKIDLKPIYRTVRKEYMFSVNIDGIDGILERIKYKDYEFFSIEVETTEDKAEEIGSKLRKLFNNNVTTLSIMDYIEKVLYQPYRDK